MNAPLRHLAPAAFCLIAFSFVVIGCQQPPPPPPPNPAETLAPLIDAYVAVWNSGDTAALDSLVTGDFMRHDASNTTADGRDSLKQVISAFRTTYPDVNVTLDEVIYTEQAAAVRWSLTGTNTGPGTIPATGKPVALSGISLVHFADGMMTEEWVASDNAAVMQQLGYTFQPPPRPRRR